MKLAVALLLAVYCLLGCGTGPQSFVGTWLVDGASMPQAPIGTSLPPDQLRIRKGLEAFRLTLKADGSYEAVSVPGVQNGHWKVDGRQIVLDTPQIRTIDISSDGSYLSWTMVTGRSAINLYRQRQ